MGKRPKHHIVTSPRRALRAGHNRVAAAFGTAELHVDLAPPPPPLAPVTLKRPAVQLMAAVVSGMFTVFIKSETPQTPLGGGAGSELVRTHGAIIGLGDFQPGPPTDGFNEPPRALRHYTAASRAALEEDVPCGYSAILAGPQAPGLKRRSAVALRPGPATVSARADSEPAAEIH